LIGELNFASLQVQVLYDFARQFESFGLIGPLEGFFDDKGGEDIRDPNVTDPQIIDVWPVPTVLYALRCHALRDEGRGDLAQALEDGPLPPLFDESSRQLIRCLGEGLRVPDPEERFRVLSRLTMRHFDREQSVFSYHMGVDRNRVYEPAPGWIGMMTRFRSVPGPAIVGPSSRRRLEFRKFALPRDFDLRNHDSRVAAFGAAFVESVTGSIDDYLVAIDYLHRRFADSEPAPSVSYNR